MSTHRIVVLLALVGLLALGAALGGCAQAGSSAPRDPAAGNGPSATADTIEPRDLMRGLVLPQRDALVEGLELGPATAAEWESLRLSASLLREASLILQREHHDDDPTWSLAAGQMLHDGSESVLAALEHRDLEAARGAYDQMSRACATCHRECTAGERPLAITGR